jgi:hypothetical protein
MIFERKTRTRGLTLLKVCCEEFVAGKNDVQTSRRRQLREALHTQVPHVLVLVKQILDEALNKPNSGCHQRSSSARNGDATAVQSSSPYRLLSISTAPENQSSMMADTFVGPLSPQYTIFRPPVGNFDTETLDNCLLCLEIVTQLFSWIPLEQHLSLPLLSTILQYTMLNDSFDAPLGCQALSCIIEFLTRKCMPKALDEYLMLIFRYMIDSLRHFIIEADNFVIDDLDEE